MLVAVGTICGAQKSTTEEMGITAQYLRDHYGRLNFDEIKRAFTMLIQERLGISRPEYIAINPATIEMVVRAFKKETHAERVEPETEKTEAEKNDIMAQALINRYEQSKQGRVMWDFGGAMYRWLLRNKYMTVTDDVKNAYRALATEQMKDVTDLTPREIMTMRRIGMQQTDHQLIEDHTGALIISAWLQTIKTKEDLISMIHERGVNTARLR